jgi:DNA-binding transcriptional LysR family regulator
MDTRFLHSFVTVVDSGSIAEAARLLDMTPATLAQRLKALEASVGSRLVTRAGRTVKPTAAGARILERARELLRGVRDLKSAASETDLPAGPLSLGATPTVMMGMLPTMLKAWVENHPGIAVYLEPGSSQALYARVLAGEVDAAIFVHPLFDLPKTCAWQPLRSEALILLTQAQTPVRDVLETLATQPFIRYDRQVVAGKMADDYLLARGIRPQVRFELDGIENIAKLVAEGLGVSVLPDWPVIGAPNPALRRWPLPPPVPARSVGVAWLPSGARSALVRAFVELAQAQSQAQAAAADRASPGVAQEN